ncbi:hypothetical protein PUNSTDRAFT_89659 [Punctularia strigosozonata HHB-11173 SS5]|uniref:uncharacterized protein n=1 Tax=Punctularia strigosozonata (strain HHB-11173) TaxID=741275 RepID=UPI0004417820|nr:uncharacterized protein PUNSTDRAFT_89659 [Punctularia strigosozonata HHB-11173 SS5]EIN07386.1 hypothetical protein PUNSTDRAFT_89659 [Punctularia strigosozonata HHB-11173 SS5]
MDAALKELDKLQQLTSSESAAKAKSPSIHDSLNSLLKSLNDAKNQVEASIILSESSSAELSQDSREALQNTLTVLPKLVEGRKKDLDNRQKEIYNVLSKIGKVLDKRFTNPLPEYDPLFTSPEARAALEKTIALHYLRTGQFDIAEAVTSESDINIPPGLNAQFVDLFRILTAIKSHDIGPALDWAQKNRSFLEARSSPLEFLLHRSQYIRLLLASHPPEPLLALNYARANFGPFHQQYFHEITRLMTCPAYLPLARLQASPYADLASPSLHFDLEHVFAKEYCARLGMSRQAPLRVVGDVGGGGALARIEKGRRVMRERRSEWSHTDELPIEVPVPAENRYHSIFACPVSKEQTTEHNPPMMMTCGHVIAKDSLNKLSKAGGRVKCPYCPQESSQDAAIRIHF